MLSGAAVAKKVGKEEEADGAGGTNLTAESSVGRASVRKQPWLAWLHRVLLDS